MAKVKTPGGYSVPAKYVAGLTGAERQLRLKQLDEMRKKGKLIGDLSGDKKAKTRKSKHTAAYARRYGDGK